MGIKLGRPLVLSENPDYQLDEIHIVGIANKKHKLVASFVLKDESSKVVDVKTIVKEGEDYNEFYMSWDAPIATRLLYAELDGAPNVSSLPSSLEDELISPPADSPISVPSNEDHHDSFSIESTKPEKVGFFRQLLNSI